MADSRNLRFRLIGDDVSLGKTLDDADRNASGLASKLGGTLARGAVTLAAGFGAATIAGVGFGLKTAASMEQARISFTTMLGSAEKADGFLRDLSKFAASTPFEFPELQTAASSLISAGIEASKVIPIMTSLGNATSGMGTGAEGVQRATVALQQMSAAGRITGEDLNQLRDAGIPVFDLLASATGKSKEAVAQLAQSGKLGKKEMEQLFKALETGKGLERFNGLMEKQSQSLTGIVSSLKDNVSMTLANLVAPAIPPIKAGLTTVGDFIGEMGPKLTTKLGEIGPALGPVFDDIKTRFDGLNSDLGSKDFSGIGRRLGESVGDGLNSIVDLGDRLLTALEGLIGKVDWPKLAIEIGKQAPAVALGFVLGLLNFDIGQAFGVVIDHWQLAVFGLISLAFAPARFIGKLASVLGKIPFAGRLIEWGVNALKGFADNVVGAVGRFFSAFGSGFMTRMGQIFPEITGAFSSKLTALGEWLLTQYIRIGSQAIQLPIKIGSAILSGAGKLGAAVAEVIGGTLRAFGSMVTDVGKFGVDMMAGLARGIMRGAGAVLSAIKESVTDKLPGFVKKALGINSPSRVFAALGVQIPAGLAMGIADAAPKATDAVDNMLRDLTPNVASSTATTAASGSLAGRGGGGITVSVVVQGSVTTLNDLAADMEDILTRRLRTNGALGFLQ